MQASSRSEAEKDARKNLSEAVLARPRTADAALLPLVEEIVRNTLAV